MLAFDATTHSYTFEGIPVPSVTQVLAGVGLIDYSFLPAEAREEYLRRGTAVHLACQFADDGDLDEASIDPAVAGYLSAWQAFRHQTGFTSHLNEQRVFHKHYRYAGTPDRVGEIGQVPYILDLKSGYSPDWVPYQLAAYAGTFEQPMRYRRLSVALREDGSYKTFEFPCKEYVGDFHVFLAALTIFNLKRRQPIGREVFGH